MMRRIAVLVLCSALAVPALAQTTLNGAGATFPYPMYSKWFSEYHNAHPTFRSITSRSAAGEESARYSRAQWISARVTVR